MERALYWFDMNGRCSIIFTLLVIILVLIQKSIAFLEMTCVVYAPSGNIKIPLSLDCKRSAKRNPPVIYHIHTDTVWCKKRILKTKNESDILHMISKETSLDYTYLTLLMSFGAIYIAKNNSQNVPIPTRLDMPLPQNVPAGTYLRVHANPMRYYGLKFFLIVLLSETYFLKLFLHSFT